MGMPFDPTHQTSGATAIPVTPLTDPCGWCMGRGSYLEALECDLQHAYLPVVCQGCGGDGRRRSG